MKSPIENALNHGLET